MKYLLLLLLKKKAKQFYCQGASINIHYILHYSVISKIDYVDELRNSTCTQFFFLAPQVFSPSSPSSSMKIYIKRSHR